MRARLRALAVAVALAALAGAIGCALIVLPLSTLPSINRIADLSVHVASLDARLGFARPAFEAQPNPNLAIVTLDDASLHALGFPLPRSAYARLLQHLRAAGARAVAFDIEFLEPSKAPAQDAAFAAALRTLPTVLAFSIDTSSGGRLGEQRPAPMLAPAASAIGYLTVDTPGGYVIGQPMHVETAGEGTHGAERLFSLAAAATRAYSGKDVDTKAIPVDDDGRMLLLPPPLSHHQDLATQTDVVTQQFAGRGTLSFADALQANPSQLQPFARGALVFVGATAQGLGDYVTTAGRGRTPGLFVNARLADQLMRGAFLTPAPLWLDALAAFVLALCIAFAFSRLPTGVAIAAAVAAMLAYAYADLWLFAVKLYWLDLVHVVLAMLLATTFVALYRTLHEGAQRRLVTNLFGMHVSPAVVSDILARDDPRSALALAGKRVEATVFYSDIRGFTAMSEAMSPEAVYAQLNEYFDAMCAIIFEYGGYVDKFIGDCVMAVFSAPYQTPDDALNAVRAAVLQQRRIAELCERWKSEGKPVFAVGMGINTGEVVMGNLGASSRMNYTVIGDEVNIAARLYNVARGGEIVVSETTFQRCGAAVDAVALEPVEVKGKSRPIAIYRVVGLTGACTVPSSSSP